MSRGLAVLLAGVGAPGGGIDNRGARRSVAGEDGSRFCTADHDSSFREVVSG